MELWGWGRKNTANVNSKGQLLTFAEAISADYEATLVNDAFTMDIDGIQTDGVGYWLAIIKNGHSIKDLVIMSIVGWVPAFSNTQIYEAVIGQTFVYATNGTAIIPANDKSGITGGAQGEFYVNDGSGNITTIGGTGIIVGRFIYDTRPISWNLDIIVPPGQTFMLRSDLADKLNASIHFYYKDNR